MAVTDLIRIPRGINRGLSPAGQRTMLSLLGNPRGSYNEHCQPVTHPALRNLVVTDSVGPFRVTGLLPAVNSLKEVIVDIRREQPDVHAALGTAGMLCARFVRGSITSISNHSWGMAVDLNLNGHLDSPHDGRVQEGMARIAPIFNRHKWFWGGGFTREDGMHFEISDQLVREWHAAGVFGSSPGPQPDPALSLGDRGPEVRLLQEKLNALGENLEVDGDFGRDTLAAVMAFQAAQGLDVDGIVGSETRRALGLRMPR